MSTKKKLVRRVLLPVALLATALAALAPSAQAWSLTEHHWESELMAGYGTQPPYGYNSYEVTGIIAAYEGAGTVNVCQETEDWTTFVVHKGCANGAVGDALNLAPYYGHLLKVAIRNNSPYKHTIDGYFYTGHP